MTQLQLLLLRDLEALGPTPTHVTETLRKERCLSNPGSWPSPVGQWLISKGWRLPVVGILTAHAVWQDDMASIGMPIAVQKYIERHRNNTMELAGAR